jgi:hypothetical protein
VDDDTPVVNGSTDLIYANSSNPTGGTGIYDYDIGADKRTSFSALNSDFVLPVLTGTVGAAAISNIDVDWASEDASKATFDFSFKYAANPSTPAVLTEATGTLVFDKVAGTYTVQLDEPLEGFTVLSTKTAVDVQGYDAGGSKEDNAGPADVFVAQLSNDFFVQFTGISDPLNAGGNGAFVPGEKFAGSQADVIVSSTDMGVGSNTIQSGEVLDLNFYSTNPTGVLNQPTTASKDAVFLQFFGIGTADIVILLKLQSASNPGTTTTKTIVVENSDIFQTQNATLDAFGIVLGNGQSAVIIESNDYNFGLEDYKVTGLQILSAVDGITGDGINLNPATGAGGASPEPGEPATQPLSTGDGQVIKVVNIGFADTTSTTLDANLHFDVAVKDADNDVTSTTTLDVNIVGGTTFTGTASAESIHGSAGHDTITGGGGNDIIEGGAGNDTIDSAAAGAGNDTITGGAGIDTIDVSQGNDTVKFTSKLDGNDVVNGFDADSTGGQDTIDLDVLFDNYGAMSGTRASHVNIADSGSDTIVQIDTDNNVGNGYEMNIKLANVADHTSVTVGTDVNVGS